MPAPPSNANAGRFDPYKNYRFKVKMDGNYVAGVSKVGGLKRSTDVIKRRAGGDPGTVRVTPGQSTYDAITLEQGVTHDVSFEQWANSAHVAPRVGGFLVGDQFERGVIGLLVGL